MMIRRFAILALLSLALPLAAAAEQQAVPGLGPQELMAATMRCPTV